MTHPVRNSDPKTSHESAKLRTQISDLARQAEREGLTSNEAERQIPDHKSNSVSPRFAELVERGDLVRAVIGYTKKGRPIYMTRFDPITKRNVIIHWLPEFAPLKKPAQSVTVKAIKSLAKGGRRYKF